MKSLSTKVTDEFKCEVERIAGANGKTASDLVRLCIEAVVYEHYRLDGDHIVPTDEYLNALRPVDVTDYDRLNFGVLRDAYERCGYPAHVVRKNNEMLAAQIRDAGRFSSKRYSDDPC